MAVEVNELINMALKQHQSGDLIEAEKLYCEIIKLHPKNADALNLLGLLNIQKNQFEQAIYYINKAISLKPSAYFWENLGRAYDGCKDYKNSIECYKNALNLDSIHFNALFNLALAYKRINRFDESVETYNKAMMLKPNNPEIYFNLGNIYEHKNDTNTALEYYTKAYELGINYDNIGYFLGISYLKLKNFKQGWKYYENRPGKEFSIRTQEHQLKEIITTKPLWSGESIKDKTLFVYYEAGLGDSIMYARYIPYLKEKCKNILFKPQNCLANLFKDTNLGAKIIDVKTSNEEIKFDVHIPIMSITYVLQHNSEADVPFKDKYIIANSKKVEKYKEKYFNTDKFKIGIKWQGNPHYDRNRIIPLEKFYKLFNLPNTKFYSIQKDDGAEELKNIPKDYDITDLSSSFKDFSDTAAAIENLDLVICNDTSVAHLVGAMGKPCWIMLPYVSNWRWHNDTTYSPWYNSVKLFQQKELENWDEIFNEAYENLKKLLN